MVTLLALCMSISLASYANHSLPDIHLLALLGLGAFLMRGAGCVINDLWDRKIDQQVSCWNSIDKGIFDRRFYA